MQQAAINNRQRVFMEWSHERDDAVENAKERTMRPSTAATRRMYCHSRRKLRLRVSKLVPR